jgi:hypothetical protein
MFLELPDAELYPGYFAGALAVCKSPICLNGIKRRIEAGAYRTWDAFESDVLLMVKNGLVKNRSAIRSVHIFGSYASDPESLPF